MGRRGGAVCWPSFQVKVDRRVRQDVRARVRAEGEVWKLDKKGGRGNLMHDGGGKVVENS